MNCVNHVTRSGLNTCSKCGDWLCEECTIESDNRLICKECLAKETAKAVGKTAARAETRTEYRRDDCPHCSPKRSYSRLLILLLSAMPGTAYMYMGLMKRGLFVLCSFFGTVYFTTFMHSPLPGFVMAIIFITSLFDSFNIRARLRAGEYISDDITDITGFLKKYRLPIALLSLFALVGGFFRDISRGFSRFFFDRGYYYSNYFGNFSSIIWFCINMFIVLVLLAIMIAGIVALVRFTLHLLKPRRHVEHHEHIEHGDNQ